MGRLGRIAEEGDEVEFEGGRIAVLSMSGRRIERLVMTRAQEVGEEREE
jgi:CBS domain containing-hemolysin-like protein